MVYYIKFGKGEIREFTTKLEAKDFMATMIRSNLEISLAHSVDPVDPETLEFVAFKGRKAEEEARLAVDVAGDVEE